MDGIRNLIETIGPIGSRLKMMCLLTDLTNHKIQMMTNGLITL